MVCISLIVGVFIKIYFREGFFFFFSLSLWLHFPRTFVRRSFSVGVESQTVSFTSSNKPGLSTAGGGTAGGLGREVWGWGRN